MLLPWNQSKHLIHYFYQGRIQTIAQMAAHFVFVRSQDRSQISHTLQCTGCNEQFEGKKALRKHVREQPECLSEWGGSQEKLSQMVDSIYDRRRKTRSYWENPDKQRKRKRSTYDDDPDKERERKREEYAKGKLTRQSDGGLGKFLEEGKYGPIFPCIYCHQLKWQTSVTVADSSDLNSPFTNIHYVTIQHRSLFKKQDRFWQCRTCKTAISRGERPKMCTQNCLHCPWDDVPPHLLKMNEVGSECL